MKTPIFDSIINGALSPLNAEQAAVPFSDIYRGMINLPGNLSQLESLIEVQLGKYVSFDFAEEKAISLGIPGEEYHEVPDYKYPIRINVFPEIDDTPEHRFYNQIMTAQSLQTILALKEFSSTAKADIDTKGEVKRTLEGIYHLSLQLKDVLHGQVIKYSLKQQMIKLYYEIAYTFNHILAEDKIAPFEDYYFALFNSYPPENIVSIFTAEKIKAKIQSVIMAESNDITTQKTLLNESVGYIQLQPISIWLANYVFTEVFAIDTTAKIDSERGSRDLVRFFCDQKTTEYAKAASKSDLIFLIEADIESVDDLCEVSPTSAPSQARAWLYEQLHAAEAKPGSSSSDDYSHKDGLLYKDLATKVEQIKDLYDFLIKQGKIDPSTEYTNFKRVFSGNFATTPIKWTGLFVELMAMFKQMKDDKVFKSDDRIWEKVAKSFVRPDGRQFNAKQVAAQRPKESHLKFAQRASELLTA